MGLVATIQRVPVERTTSTGACIILIESLVMIEVLVRHSLLLQSLQVWLIKASLCEPVGTS